MIMQRWQGIEKVVVVGLGITGLSVVKHLKRLPLTLQVKVIDTRANPPGAEDLPEDVALHTGSWRTDWLLDADLVVTNPGIALATPEIQQVLAANIPVVGDIELFAWHVDKPVIAITGSNGKSTVTDLTGVVAKASGLTVGVGGNIGVPALDLLTLNADLYVLELSSFQLETTSSLELVAAAFLNLSEDHMDRYQGMADYRQAKLRIFDHAQACIVNADDPESYPLDSCERLDSSELVEFSIAKSAAACVSEFEGIEYLTYQGERILPVDQLSIVGRHNVANALVVIALLFKAGVDVHSGLEAMKSYRGLTHRCQVVADNQGIKWVNDSKATNVASTLAALSGLNLAGKLYLFVGGDGKGADFNDLVPALSRLNLQLCCFGADGDKFMPLHPSAKRFDTMQEIIAWAKPQLNQGDMVLLSPACASFDQFSNFMARGDVFAALAQQFA